MTYLESLFSLEGRTAIVTGASRGLGRAAALALNGAGANVVLIGRDGRMLEETLSLLPDTEKALLIEANVNSADARKKVISETLQDFGAVDILVNNAGIIRRSPAIEYSAEDWSDVIETNLNSVFHWSQDAAKEMMKSGGGKI